MQQVTIYDTTLRDGTQMEGMSLSVGDKLKLASKLDELGVHLIEGGWPGSNPKDIEFFKKAQKLELTNATIVAFGSTRKAGNTVEQDANLLALLNSKAPVITLVCKSWDMHVEQVLETSLEENLAMISESIKFLRGKGRRVFLDAEHFFDGFKANPSYAQAVVDVAEDAGAEYVVLCDTNGGTIPTEIFNIVGQIRSQASVELGIHCHNDAEMAVANSIAAVQAGASQVQGTINGYGERCGNANLISVIANLSLKLNINSIPEERLALLTEAHRFVSEVVNLPPNRFQAYVGESAFSHKAGLHASAVAKIEESYQHITPSLVGNTNKVVVSELSGRGNIAVKLEEVGLSANLSKEMITSLLELLKQKESVGFQYEGAEASFELLVRRSLEGYQSPFELVDFLVVIEKRRRSSTEIKDDESLCEAMVKVKINDQIMHTVAEGNGPVNALDAALRKGLVQIYPSLKAVELRDYKVRVVEQGDGGTGATVRVLIESSDGSRNWSTVGASSNIIEASWQALADSMEYALLI